MANCSYARCVQERRLIKRELQKWTRSMVYIVGLERVAEELMGRRKWALYQDVLTTTQPIPQQEQQEEQQRQCGENAAAAAAEEPVTEQTQLENNSTASVDDDNNKVSLEQQSLTPKGLREDDDKESVKNGSEQKTLTEEEEEEESVLQKQLKQSQPQLANHSCCHKKQQQLQEEEQSRIEVSLVTTPPTPVDWEPQDKCYFCDKGKLLAVNDRGELVAESGPSAGDLEPELIISTNSVDSDSDSSDIGSEALTARYSANNGNHQQQQQRSNNKHLSKNRSKMTSLESVVAAVASMHGIPAVPGLSSFYPGLWYPFANSLQSGGAEGGGTSGDSASSNNGKMTSGGGDDHVVGGNLEQPLDLSAKSSSTSGVDQKNIFKAKPRMTTISGRRTYTEDELQNALQDILSGKLGTRRAAVLYGIPRSTLRNKVYKLAIEQKREANLTAVAPVLADLDDDDKDCSGAEEEKEVERTLNSLPSEDIFRMAAVQGLAAFQKIGKTEEYSGDLQQQQQQHHLEVRQMQQHSPTLSKPQTPALSTNLLDPNIILQGLLISGALSGLTNSKALENTTLGMLPEFFRNILLHNELLKSSEGGRASKSDTPETASVGSTGRSGSEQNEIVDELHLKVPSFKPISGPGLPSMSPSSAAVGFLSRNGDNMSKNAFGNSAGISGGSANIPSRRSPQQSNILGVSPPLMPTAAASESSSSPPIPGIGSVSLRDVIAKSISKTMHPPLQMDLSTKKSDAMHSPTHHGVSSSSLMDPYKWPTISVKKGLGAEMNRFGGGMSSVGSNMLSSNASLNSQLNNSTGTGGKGTRPKRGKYRNYDRDSLVEAVKAVQRGEMSVHRAGSYYGVPHSTLEYKVKERHLMRPRKREPKPQPLDDGRSSSVAGGSSSAATSMKVNDMPSVSVIRNPLDNKSKMTGGSGGGSASKSPMKTPPFDPTSPNGLKGQPFLDSALVAAQLQYPSHMFWPPHPPNFPGMSLDFSRANTSSSSASSVAAATGAFTPSESFFAAQMRQRFQEHAANAAESAGNASTSNSSGSGNSSANNSKSTTPNSAVTSNNSKPPPLQQQQQPPTMLAAAKSTRDFAESLYDGASANGSFLDGIIRHSLDRKSVDLHHGTLLDQLVKNNLQFGGSNSNSNSNNNKRESGAGLKRSAMSPLNLGSGSSLDIKRERASPSNDDDDEDDDEGDVGQSLRNLKTNHHPHHPVQNDDFNGNDGGTGGDGSGAGGLIQNNILSYSTSNNNNSGNHNAGDAKNLKARHAILSSSEHEEENEDSS